LRIAICDDSAEDREAIRAALTDYMNTRDILAEVEVFPCVEDFLTASCDAPFDLYLLDIVMPQLNGLQVAKELHRFQEHAPVVYFSTSKDYALEAYGVQALGYVVKPWTREQFDGTMDLVFDAVGKKDEVFVMFKTQDGLRRFDISKIVCVTVSKTANFKTIHFCDGETIDVRMTLDAIMDACRGFSGKGRVQLFADGRYALVNLYRVRSISEETVTFDNGDSLMIHHKNVAALRRAVVALPW